MYVVKFRGKEIATTHYVGEANYLLSLMGEGGTIEFQEVDAPPWWVIPALMGGVFAGWIITVLIFSL